MYAVLLVFRGHSRMGFEARVVEGIIAFIHDSLPRNRFCGIAI